MTRSKYNVASKGIVECKTEVKKLKARFSKIKRERERERERKEIAVLRVQRITGWIDEENVATKGFRRITLL